MLIRIATRKSKLALWQANYIAGQLKHHHPGLEVQLIPMMTDGDRWLDQPLVELGGKGLFIKALEEAILAGEADIAVHSMKDVPYALPAGLVIPCITVRENPYDVLLMRDPEHQHWQDLPLGACVGTSSLRRQLQLQILRPDLSFKLLRGNVPTRINKLEQGEYDAIILAQAGLIRLEITKAGYQFSADEMLPAVGQGAVGVECRAKDRIIRTLLTPLHHPKTADCVLAERAMNQTLQGGCHAPIAGFATITGRQLTLTARVGHLQTQRLMEASARGVNPSLVGKTVAEALLGQGAADWLAVDGGVQ